MEEDGSPKPLLKFAQLEISQLKPTFIVASEPRPTEKKKTKKLNKPFLSGSGTAFQPKTQDEVVVNIGGRNTEVHPNVFPMPMGNVAPEKGSSDDSFARVKICKPP